MIDLYPIGAAVITKYNNRPGHITGYLLHREKYVVVFEDGTSKPLSGTSLKRADPPLRGAELLDEIEFFLNQGESPLLVPQLIGRHPDVVMRIAREHGRTAVTAAFVAAGVAEHDRKIMRGVG